MKPAPLLATLVILAIVASLIIWNTKAPPRDSLDPAPLPPSDDFFGDIEEPGPVVLLEGPLVPHEDMVQFVEKHLKRRFRKPPVFTPVPAIEIIEREKELLSAWDRLEETGRFFEAMGWNHEFTPLLDNLITIRVGEVRGYLNGEENWILHDFQPDDPRDQVALVELLARRLATEQLPPLPPQAAPATILARQHLIATLGVSTRKAFDKTLPPSKPSLHENIRESLMMSVPVFFYELASYPEFQILPHLKRPEVPLAFTDREAANDAHALLQLPEQKPTFTQYSFGPTILHILLYQSEEPNSVRPLAATLRGDKLEENEEGFLWTLVFSNADAARQVHQVLSQSPTEPTKPPRRYEQQGNEVTIAVALPTEDGENLPTR
ncbi:MAG: hypothetical protein Q7Q71_10635 [Verrucomicrobiota bacterium JB023]|nr:hypothetical protein [Verrucomicrobiota bacterium JB023]